MMGGKRSPGLAFKDQSGELYTLEILSGRDSPVHRLHPGVKIIGTLGFIVCLLSFDRYSLGRLFPFLLYPCILLPLADIPASLLLKRSLAALPFCLFAGITNIILERGPALTLAGIPISFGILSFLVLTLRSLLSVMAVLILVAATPLVRLTAQLRRFHVPAIFVLVLEIMYRYIGLLFGEAHSMSLSYALRGGGGKGIRMRDMGSFTGRLFLRSSARAERVYTAMKCRGYSLNNSPRIPGGMGSADIVYLVLTLGSCLLFRLVNLPQILGTALGKLF